MCRKGDGMTKEEIQVFTRKVTQSNRTQLVVVTFEIILKYLDDAMLEEAAESEKEMLFNLKKAKQFLDDLSTNLDFQYPISHQLFRLYLYCNNLLTMAIVKKETENISTVQEILGSLKKSFEEIAKEDHSGPVMENTKKVYAGLTYGKGTLNEVALDHKSYN